MAAHKPAAQVANWRAPDDLWLDHARVVEDDLEWMAPARYLVLWNVRLPDGFLARLPNLAGLSVRGGSAEDLAVVGGCERLRCLDVRHVRGLRDLSDLQGLRSLEFLGIYAQPRVQHLRDLRVLEDLSRVELGSMKGLASLEDVLSLPALRTLLLSKAVGMSADDAGRVAEHPTLEEFEWLAEDVPDRVWQPVAARTAHLRRPRYIHPEDWLAERLGDG